MASVETVTILVTDLVGSTGLESRIGPGAADELRTEHFKLLGDAFEAAGGREVKNTGDGLMAAFESAWAAVGCAVEIQQRIERRNRFADEQLLIKIGVSLGDATAAEGDYFGMPVIEAARLCARATGGQILVKETVAHLAAGRVGDALKPVGALELKGLPEPLPTVEVTWEPLGAEAGSLPVPPLLQEVPPVGFVGRSGERERLRALADQARKGRLQLALIPGEPGVGKTRLSTHAALDERARGAALLYGRSDQDLSVPYGPWVQGLSHYVENVPERILRAHVDRHGGELARVVPSLGERIPDAPAPRETDPDTERYLLWGAIAGLLRDASREEPIVLVLDDLHWADKPTLSLMEHMVAHGAEIHALLIATYRESELDRGHPLSPVLAHLHREQGVERIALKGLDEPDIVQIMERAAGHEMDEVGLGLARELFREADGNPFYTGEILRHLLESGAIHQQDDGRWTVRGSLSDLALPQSVREVVGHRVERLGEQAQKVLQAAAVIGREFDTDLLLPLTECSEEDELLDILEEAVEASVVTESAKVAGRFSFAHALINHTLYAALGTTRRARLHRSVAETLERLCGGDPGARVSELAYHWAMATTAVDVQKAITYARLAGERALSELAPDEALRWFTQALELLDQAGEEQLADRCDLLIGLGEAQRQVGEADFRETLLEAAVLACEMGDDDRLTRAALANTRGFTSEMGRVDDERVEMLQSAAEGLPDDDSRRADALALLAMELSFGDDSSRRVALAREALALARERSDDETLTRVIDRYLFATWLPETLSERLELSSELIARADRAGDPLRRLLAYNRRIYYVLENGDAAEADECVRHMREIAQRVSQPFLSWVALYMEGMMAQLHGRLEEADALLEDAVGVGTEGDQPDAVLFYAVQLCGVRYDQGRTDEIVELVEQSVEDNPGLPAWRGFHACILCELGRDDEALPMLADESYKVLPHDFLRLAGLAYWADACAQLGAVEYSEDLYARLEPFRDQVIDTGAHVVGAVSHYLGLLSAVAGDHDRASRDFDAAAAAYKRMDAPVMLARTEEAWGRSLIASGGTDDRERASSLLESAARRARERGADGIARRAEAAVT
jgi:class 3 adenylate cyclase/tetratricopeptide (TPR) repeat protein